MQRKNILIIILIVIIFLILNTKIYYRTSEIIYYPNEDKTYLEQYKVKQTIWSYITHNGVFNDNELIEFTQIELN